MPGSEVTSGGELLGPVDCSPDPSEPHATNSLIVSNDQSRQREGFQTAEEQLYYDIGLLTTSFDTF